MYFFSHVRQLSLKRAIQQAALLNISLKLLLRQYLFPFEKLPYLPRIFPIEQSLLPTIVPDKRSSFGILEEGISANWYLLWPLFRWHPAEGTLLPTYSGPTAKTHWPWHPMPSSFPSTHRLSRHNSDIAST